MSLRSSVFLAVLLVVVCTTATEALLDVVIDQFEDQRLFLDLLDIPVMLLIAAVGAWLLARRIALPLKALTEATRHVAALGPTRPPLEPTGKDELATLVTGFNDMALAIEGYVERERAFTRYASHELRTPLSAMRLQVERAQLGHVTAEEVLPGLARGVEQLEEIIAALLTLAREAETTPVLRQASSVLNDVISILPLADRRRVTVRYEAPEVRVTHPRLFQQAVTNLVDNALRHTSGATTVALSSGGQTVTLRVNDHGPGLSGRLLERATDAFYRGPEPLPEAGHGLGLSFVAFLAKALEGDLLLSSSEGGLMAELTLPIVADTALA